MGRQSPFRFTAIDTAQISRFDSFPHQKTARFLLQTKSGYFFTHGSKQPVTPPVPDLTALVEKEIATAVRDALIPRKPGMLLGLGGPIKPFKNVTLAVIVETFEM